MWRFSLKYLILSSVFVTVLFVFCFQKFKEDEEQNKNLNIKEVTIVVVACGEKRSEEAITMVKSALIFSTHHLKVVLITEKPMFEVFRPQLESFQKFHNFTFILKEAEYPENSENDWKNLFAPCATERLFLPSLLLSENIDSVLYVDSDTLFLSPPYDTFQMLHQFNSTQISGIAQNSQSNKSYYPKMAPHPFYGLYGLNSGVILMNLTRMREIEWEKKVVSIFKQYKSNLRYHDQDIINIYFNFHPEEMFELQCEFNYRTDQCANGMKSCPTAVEGVKILHGNRHSFHNPNNIFGVVFTAFQKVNVCF